MIILFALILDLFFDRIRSIGVPTELIGVDTDINEITVCSGDTIFEEDELIPVIIGTGSGCGGSHSVLDKARLDDHNDYEPE